MDFFRAPYARTRARISLGRPCICHPMAGRTECHLPRRDAAYPLLNLSAELVGIASKRVLGHRRRGLHRSPGAWRGAPEGMKFTRRFPAHTGLSPPSWRAALSITRIC